MTDHRTTEQIIDAIDHCLDDFTVSGDAMRYVPEPPLADWEKALTAHPFDPDARALRPFSMQETRRPRHVWESYPVIFDEVHEWSADEPSDAAEPQSLPERDREFIARIETPQIVRSRGGDVPEGISIGFDVGRGVHMVPIVGRGWGRQALLDRLRQDRENEQARQQLTELADAAGRAVDQFVEWAERCAADMGMALSEWQRNVAAMVAAAMPDLPGLSIADQDVEDPRDRALRLRQQRNTGPSRDRTRQRRPREH